MKRIRRQKLMWLLLLIVILACAAALILYALRQNISLFYSPTQITQGEAPLHHHIRAGGMVVNGSVKRQSNLNIDFSITDNGETIQVHYKGILPDLFREGNGVVVQGELIDMHHMNAVEVLAKHDENYMPPEVRATLIKTTEKSAA